MLARCGLLIFTWADCPFSPIKTLCNSHEGVFEDIFAACTEGTTPQPKLPPAAEHTNHHQQQHQIQQASQAASHSATEHQHRLQQAHRHKQNRLLPLYCHCDKPVQWQRGRALCGKAGDKQRRYKVYQQKMHCCHCQKLFDFTSNTLQTDNTWRPYQRASL